MNKDTIFNSKKGRIVLGAGFLLFVLAGIFGFSQTQRPSGSISVTVQVMPTGATITANDKKLSNGTAYLKPGTYDVVAVKDGYQRQTAKIVIDANHTYILLSLPAVSEEAKTWYKDNAKLYSSYETNVGKASRQSGLAFKDLNPITRLLPADKLVFKIGYVSPDEKTITLTIYAITAEQRRAALQQIRDWGYDPTDFKISFIQFTNPLLPAEQS